VFKFIRGLVLTFCLFFSNFAFAGQWYSGATGAPIKGGELAALVGPGTVVVYAEQHDNEEHHQNQRDFLVKMSGGKFPLSVGMEFFEYPHQKLIDQYGREEISEDDFLKQIKWGKNPFDFYRFQVLLPYYLGGRTYGLNIPRSISGQVAKAGMESLTEEQRALLPPDFTLGSETYYERFHETMKGHVPEKSIQNYFAAQSLWDETMAWRTALAMQELPEQVMVIHVGDFHVAYQDGLIARLKARGVQKIVSISQINTKDMSAEERAAEIQPHARYGARADFIFDSHGN
jgi:uncharacterized iron-regulated protein